MLKKDLSGGRRVGGHCVSSRHFGNRGFSRCGFGTLLGNRGQDAREARDRRLHQTEQLREQHFLARNGRQGFHPVGVERLAGVRAAFDDQLVVALGKVGGAGVV